MLAIEWLDTYSDSMPLSVRGTVIPMLEVALDGALLKFLLDTVEGPVCHQVFEKINNDESRHIAVDFEVLNMIRHATARRLAIEFVGTVATPGLPFRLIGRGVRTCPDRQDFEDGCIHHGPVAQSVRR